MAERQPECCKNCRETVVETYHQLCHWCLVVELRSMKQSMIRLGPLKSPCLILKEAALCYRGVVA